MERCATRNSCAWNAAQSGLDGGGVRPASEIFEREYRANCRAGWPRKFSGRTAARETRALSDGAHRSVGIVLFCARALRISCALPVPANRRPEDRCTLDRRAVVAV